MIGQTIAHYRVTAKLGAGGMGEVYRATDAKLGRDVALKLLPEAFAQDVQRMQRFQREAQVLASLNHPHIAAIYGLETQPGQSEAGRSEDRPLQTHALVMELVEGPTLAERIAQDAQGVAGKMPAIPLDEALPIAKQIAEALEYAHERGIIHRDLKPANIKLAADGQVKVLDFGLAKALGDESAMPDIANSPTLSVAATKAGVILGTAAYMSPEQARGKSVDRRADIWSFGAVLYEMLTGARAFGGEDVSVTLANVIKEPPDWKKLPLHTPQRLRELLKRCLTKDVRQRLQAIGEARILLDNAECEESFPIPESTARAQNSRKSWLWAGAVAVLSVLATFGVMRFLQPKNQPGLRKFSIPISDLRVGIVTPPAISPDGRKIIYVAGSSLWIREIDQFEPRELVKGADIRYPFWSPDSAQVAYYADQRIWRMALSGGQPVVVAPVSFSMGGSTPGGAWAAGGTIYFAPANAVGMMAVSDQGGDFREVVPRDETQESDFHKPSPLPGGKGLVFVVDRNKTGADTIEVWTGTTRKQILQLPNEYLNCPVYSPTGHIVYQRSTGNAGIWAVPFSLERLEITGEPFLVVGDGSWPSVAADGTLLYGTEGGNLTEGVVLNRQGEVTATLGPPDTFVRSPRFSPDGNRLVLYKGSLRTSGGIYSFDRRRQTLTPLTFDGRLNLYPAWAGNDRIIYESHSGGGEPDLNMVSTAGGTPERLVGRGERPNVSADGKAVVFSSPQAQGHELAYVRLDGDRRVVPLVTGRTDSHDPVFSPDGRFIAFAPASTPTQREVYVTTFPKGEELWQVSAGGGGTPRWDPSGKKIYYANGSDLMEVDVTLSPRPVLGTPRVLIAGAKRLLRLDLGYDVSPDGKSFAVVREAQEDKPVVRSLQLVENWFTEFRDKQKQ